MSWFDSHCHPELDVIEEELAYAKERDVAGLIAVGTTPEKSRGVMSYLKQMRRIAPEFVSYGSVGVHPHDAAASGMAGVRALEQLINEDDDDLVVGVGECGLDYYYEHSPRSNQIEIFKAQIDLALRYDKTLVIHTRDAWNDTFEVLSSVELPRRVIFHCFVGTEKEAKVANDLGIYMSFSGIVTFKNSDELRAAAKVARRDLVLVETDAPYLTPVPLRGKPNLFGNVSLTGTFLAELLDLDVAAFKDLTWRNTRKAFAI